MKESHAIQKMVQLKKDIDQNTEAPDWRDQVIAKQFARVSNVILGSASKDLLTAGKLQIQAGKTKKEKKKRPQDIIFQVFRWK